MLEDDFDMSVMLAAVLEESGYAEKRASKMDVDDFLKYAALSFPPTPLSSETDPVPLHRRLLTVFHKHGLHFA